MSKYTIGIDFGTLSARAVLVDVSDGKEIGCEVFDYPHGVIDRELPDGKKLPKDWALQHPQDFLDAMMYIVPMVAALAENAHDIIGIGVDFTASTAMPVYADGTPLCFTEKYKDEPHAYVKLWKHHSAQPYAEKMTQIANERNEAWLKRYGGTISSEWTMPKLWELVNEAPDIYNAMAHWQEAGDWIVWLLTGVNLRNSCTAGYKAFYDKDSGFPDKSFFAALDPRLTNVIEEKLSAPVAAIGTKAGILKSEMAEKLGLEAGIAVAVSNVDAHVCVPAAQLCREDQMLIIMGTSGCHMSLSKVFTEVPGICGEVKDGILPGFVGYESGQSCVGDHFAWLCDHMVPPEYFEIAKERQMNIHQYLTSLAEKQKPGQNGLLALDWWNGNRSTLVDFDLSGLMIGMTLQTKPEDIYRALIEATAFGTRMIIENYRQHGVKVDSLCISGGISQKNAMAMQIYADVLNIPIHIAGSKQGPAVGSAIFAAVAAGKQSGGYDVIEEAANRMGSVGATYYTPEAENVSVYNELFDEYKKLYDYFGRNENNVMKHLKSIAQRA